MEEKKPVVVLSVDNEGALPDSGYSLFNGEDLTGWKVRGPNKWHVADGEIIAEYARKTRLAMLTTIESYQHFELTLEFNAEQETTVSIWVRTFVRTTKVLEGYSKLTEVFGWGMDFGSNEIYATDKFVSYGQLGWSLLVNTGNDLNVVPGKWHKLQLRVVNNVAIGWFNGQLQMLPNTRT